MFMRGQKPELPLALVVSELQPSSGTQWAAHFRPPPALRPLHPVNEASLPAPPRRTRPFSLPPQQRGIGQAGKHIPSGGTGHRVPAEVEPWVPDASRRRASPCTAGPMAGRRPDLRHGHDVRAGSPRSQARNRPVLPAPVCTSSMMSRISCSESKARVPSADTRYPGAGHPPPLAHSSITAQTVPLHRLVPSRRNRSRAGSGTPR